MIYFIIPCVIICLSIVILKYQEDVLPKDFFFQGLFGFLFGIFFALALFIGVGETVDHTAEKENIMISDMEILSFRNSSDYSTYLYLYNRKKNCIEFHQAPPGEKSTIYLIDSYESPHIQCFEEEFSNKALNKIYGKGYREVFFDFSKSYKIFLPEDIIEEHYNINE